MTVFLGNTGKILLQRQGGGQPFLSVVNPADVRADANRFSVDFAHEQIITGDRIEIRTTGGENLTWIDDPSADDSFTRFAHVDQAGGIRLYDTFSQSLIGSVEDAIDLIAPPANQQVTIMVMNGDENRCLADVTSFQITTSRDTVDTTHLGAQYRKNYEAGLIQGQGQIECFWTRVGESICDNPFEPDNPIEFSSYLARLCLRLVHGAAFHGYFYIYASSENETRSVWYESESCIVTNVAVTVTPEELVKTTIDFVTNGPITLREGYLPAYIELEQSDFDIALEQPSGGAIELENPD